MKIKINKPRNLSVLQYGRYLPRAVRKANPLLGSWVSPTYINFGNQLYKADSTTLRSRLRHTTSAKATIAALVRDAFKEKWFNWRLISKGQVLVRERVQDEEHPRILLINMASDLFDGESGYRRYLTVAALIEYFYTLYSKRFRVVFIVNSYQRDKHTSLYSKYNQQLRTKYFIAKSFGLLGSLALLSKIHKAIRTAAN